MNIALLVLWAGDGYCGTPWPGHPHGPHPEPWWWRLVGLVGGVLGGWAYSAAFPAGNLEPAVFAATSSLGAFVGGAVLRTFADMARGAGPAARG